jgi:hypothetical protein
VTYNTYTYSNGTDTGWTCYWDLSPLYYQWAPVPHEIPAAPTRHPALRAAVSRISVHDIDARNFQPRTHPGRIAVMDGLSASLSLPTRKHRALPVKIAA